MARGLRLGPASRSGPGIAKTVGTGSSPAAVSAAPEEISYYIAYCPAEDHPGPSSLSYCGQPVGC